LEYFNIKLRRINPLLAQRGSDFSSKNKEDKSSPRSRELGFFFEKQGGLKNGRTG